MTVRGLLHLGRIHTAGWEVLVFVIGPLLIDDQPPARTVAVLAVLGVLVNAFIFSLNDLADLPRDRLDPKRVRSPLVSGEVSEPVALAVSCGLPVAMWLIIAADGWPRAAEVSFAALIMLGVYLDVFQKTSRVFPPLVLDVLFSVAMAAPIVVGIAATGSGIPRVVWMLTAGFMVLCLALNSISGNLKDLESDATTGFHTVALAFGVRSDAGSIVFTEAYRWYARALGSLIAACFLATSAHAADGVGRTILMLVTGALGLATIFDLEQIVSGRRPPSPRGRDRFFVFGMLQFLVIGAALAPLVPLLLLLLLLVAMWELAFRWYWSHAWPGDSEGVTAAESDDSPLR